MLTMLLVALGLGAAVQDAATPRALSGTGHVTVYAEASTVITASVDQGEHDLAVDVFGPDGALIASVDAWPRDVEAIAAVARRSGLHRIVTRTVHAPRRGPPATIVVEPPRSIDSNDEPLVSALAAATAAKRHFDRKEPEHLRAAIATWRSLLPVWRRRGDHRAEQLSLMGLGDAHHRLGEIEAADQSYRESLLLSGERRDARSSAEITHNIGVLLWSRGRPAEALRQLESASDLWTALSRPHLEGEAATQTALGILAWEAGELDAARQFNARALGMARRMRDARAEAYVLTNSAIVLATLNRRREAVEQLAAAVRIFGRQQDYVAAGRARVRQARIEFEIGDLRSAESGLAAALHFSNRAGDRHGEADARETLARIRARQGDGTLARIEYARARALYRALGSRRGESDVAHGLGLLALEEGDATRALSLLGDARRLRLDIGARALEADTLMRMAEAAYQLGSLRQAGAWAAEALETCERIRRTIVERELRLSYTETLERYSGMYVDILLALHAQAPAAGHLATAFEVVDRLKARILVEAMRRRDSAAAVPGASELVAAERAARQEISFLSWRLWSLGDRPAPDGANPTNHARLETMVAEHAGIEASLRRLEGQTQVDQRPVTLAEVQRSLGAGLVLLQYSLGPREARVWVVTQSTASVLGLGARETVERHSRIIRRLAGQPGPAGAAALTTEVRALARRIVWPIAERLDARQIIVVADASLHYVPFGLLPDRTGSPLIAGREVVSLPSAAALLTIQSAPRRLPRSLMAVVGDPVYSPSDSRLPLKRPSPDTGQALGERRLRRLAFSRAEAERIAALAVPRGPTLLALDFDANRSIVERHELAGARFVHLATHATYDDEHADLSSVVLSLWDPNGAEVDGFLRLQDIYSLRLSADLVVLSGCSTGVGRLAGAEGLLSLARGVLHAGARQVIVSLWDVDDAATSELMVAMYRRLLGRMGETPASALRAAQLEIASHRRFAHPYFWAGWTLVGASE